MVKAGRMVGAAMKVERAASVVAAGVTAAGGQ